MCFKCDAVQGFSCEAQPAEGVARAAGPDLTLGGLNRRAILAGAGVGSVALAAPAAFAAPAPARETPAVGYAAAGPDKPLERMTFTRRALADDDVLIDILYCGVCHTDIHIAKNHFGRSVYPVLPGHEIVGRVAAVGRAVTKFKVGDRAGVGCIINSCGTCDACKKGDEQYCANGAVQTYGPHRSGANNFGGYSNRIVVRESFVIRIPNGVDLAGVAPLLCAGVTTFSPLKHWELEDARSVAVVGLGGLGHVAVKIAAARGADVTVFTTTPTKRDDALAMGAKRVVVWPDDAAFASMRSSFEYVLSTTPYAFDVNPFLGLLKTDGVFLNLGLITPPSTPINNALLMAGRRSIVGSITGSVAETQQVVDFCAARNIKADVELIPISAVNAAYDRVVKKDVRYRFVIDMTTLR